MRAVWPERLPLFIRISATDWADGGWTLDEAVELAALLKQAGADLIDCSSGGLVPYATIPVGPGYQVPFADRIRRETGVATAAVGMIAAFRPGRPDRAQRARRPGVAGAGITARPGTGLCTQLRLWDFRETGRHSFCGLRPEDRQSASRARLELYLLVSKLINS